MQEELDHVVLGEQLRHRGQGPPVDLVAALVDLVLLLGLPELVHPSQAVVGDEGPLRQAGEQFLQLQPLLRGEVDLQQHVVGAENLRQHPAGITRRKDEAVRGRWVSILGQFFALFQADGHAVRVHEQMILGQEPGEEHPMPILVGEFLGQLVNGLRFIRVPQVACLTAPGSQPVSQFLLLRSEMRERLGDIHGAASGAPNEPQPRPRHGPE